MSGRRFSGDLKRQVVAYVKAGNRQSKACKEFNFGSHTISRWIKEDSKITKARPWWKIDPIAFIELVEQNPEYGLKDLAEFFNTTSAAAGFVCRTLKITKTRLSFNKYFREKSPDTDAIGAAIALKRPKI